MDEDLLITWKEHTNASVSLLFVQRYFLQNPGQAKLNQLGWVTLLLQWQKNKIK